MTSAPYVVRLARGGRYLCRVADGPLGWTSEFGRAERFTTRDAAIAAISRLQGDFVVEAVR